MTVTGQAWNEVDFVRKENEERLVQAGRARLRRILAAAANEMRDKFESDLSDGVLSRLAVTDDEIDEYFRRGIERALPHRDTPKLHAGR